MPALVVVLLGAAAGVAVFLLLTARLKGRYMALGRSAAESEHGWRSDPFLPSRLPRQRLWRQVDEQSLVTRRFTRTSERPPLPR